MNRRFLSLCSALALTAALATAASARDTSVALTLDGRPVAGNGVVALDHDGVVFADMILLNKTFNGLLSISGKTYRTTVRGRSVAFTSNSRLAVFQGRRALLPAAPFHLHGSLYVPLASFMRGIGTTVRINAAHTAADIVTPA